MFYYYRLSSFRCIVADIDSSSRVFLRKDDRADRRAYLNQVSREISSLSLLHPFQPGTFFRNTLRKFLPVREL